MSKFTTLIFCPSSQLDGSYIVNITKMNYKINFCFYHNILGKTATIHDASRVWLPDAGYDDADTRMGSASTACCQEHNSNTEDSTECAKKI